MNRTAQTPSARELMLDFAAQTGIAPGGLPRRYLWTDAFAVCNFLELFRQSGDPAFRECALRLVDQVHHTLGRHRPDDPRSGWISGLHEDEGEVRPTAGGLRIGKELPERSPGEPFDERLEWDRDGQYFHYLAKWLHALVRVSRVTGDPLYVRWATELAQVVHARFVYSPSGERDKRMYWKMSIDLTRPLMPSMGQHDPLDGLVTYTELQAAGKDLERGVSSDLHAEIADLAGICREMSLTTDDPLGLGGLLADAWRIGQLTARGVFEDPALLEAILDAALLGLESFAGGGPLRLPASYRLAFRELGLAIGLKGVEHLRNWIKGQAELFGRKAALLRRIEAFAEYLPLAEAIEHFWLDDMNRAVGNWREHRQINMVMLATSLAPEGFLTI